MLDKIVPTQEMHTIVSGIADIFIPFIIIGIFVSVFIDITLTFFKNVICIDASRFSPLIGLVYSSLIVMSHGVGVFSEIGLFVSDIEVVYWVDMTLTSILGLGGAVGYHKVIKGIGEYKKGKET